ncbi:hypothetical protein PN36_21465 [Candidatus Thiomargarita nelsonii]|uniref:Uncharacterized protein n=1 Tax=Candidatus Thiomargarita nelsonii TaxID=1003181 RepID=A0A4E0QPF5_9GAMM|nr:hypothetical protein PN36_21465 [Candidatus Thiomargarita nelsonii]
MNEHKDGVFKKLEEKLRPTEVWELVKEVNKKLKEIHDDRYDVPTRKPRNADGDALASPISKRPSTKNWQQSLNLIMTNFIFNNRILLTQKEYLEQTQHFNLISHIKNGFHLIETPTKLYTSPCTIALFTKTPNKLYRSGNATVPRLDNARVSKDIEMFYTDQIDKAYLIKIEQIISNMSLTYFLKEQTAWVHKYGRKNWVEEGAGGISTFDSLKAHKNGYVCQANQPISDELVIINDRSGHYLWSPKIDMPLKHYLKCLKESENLFTKIN